MPRIKSKINGKVDGFTLKMGREYDLPEVSLKLLPTSDYELLEPFKSPEPKEEAKAMDEAPADKAVKKSKKK